MTQILLVLILGICIAGYSKLIRIEKALEEIEPRSTILPNINVNVDTPHIDPLYNVNDN